MPKVSPVPPEYRRSVFPPWVQRRRWKQDVREDLKEVDQELRRLEKVKQYAPCQLELEMARRCIKIAREYASQKNWGR